MSKTVAIIGASKNRAKYGNRAVRAYLSQGWKVYPVNPHEEEIEGEKAYKTVLDISEPLDRVSFYIPPEIGLKVIEQVAKKHPLEVFFNPGSESDELIKKAELLGLQPILACSITNLGLDPEANNY